jgi:hypothetical protein
MGVALKRVIECAEILNKRPRPMCRDCADECGVCPHDGLDCDMRKLFADARAELAAVPSAPTEAPSVRDSALEEAANLCVLIGMDWYEAGETKKLNAAEYCAAAIRALQGKPEAPTLECPECGTDRLKHPCPRMADECAMVADAHLLGKPEAPKGGSHG